MITKAITTIFIILIIASQSNAQLGNLLKHKTESTAQQTAYSVIDKSADKILKNGKTNTSAGVGKKDSIPSTIKSPYLLPSTITFDWEVVQKANGEEGLATHTYYFTTNGDYAGIRPDKNEDEDMSLMIYMKDGASLQFNDKTKTITIMKMTRVVGEGGVIGKQVAEGINKKPLPPPSKKNEMTLTKSGKTKMICGNMADEYLMKNEGGTSSVWYAHVSFDPVKIYTMGAGRPADLTKIKNDPKMKNNLFAIPVLNKNYLMAEMDVSGQKGMETQSITKKTIVISTAGYKIKDFSNKGLKEIIRDGEN
jgi:hypothetical protein